MIALQSNEYQVLKRLLDRVHDYRSHYGERQAYFEKHPNAARAYRLEGKTLAHNIEVAYMNYREAYGEPNGHDLAALSRDDFLIFMMAGPSYLKNVFFHYLDSYRIGTIMFDTQNMTIYPVRGMKTVETEYLIRMERFSKEMPHWKVDRISI